MRRPPPAINFAGLSDDELYAITDAQMEDLTTEEIAAYQAEIGRRSQGTHAEIQQHLSGRQGASYRPPYSQMTPQQLHSITDAELEAMSPEDFAEYNEAINRHLERQRINQERQRDTVGRLRSVLMGPRNIAAEEAAEKELAELMARS